MAATCRAAFVLWPRVFAFFLSESHTLSVTRIECGCVFSTAAPFRGLPGFVSRDTWGPYRASAHAASFAKFFSSSAMLGYVFFVSLVIAFSRSEEHTSELQSLRHLVC